MLCLVFTLTHTVFFSPNDWVTNRFQNRKYSVKKTVPVKGLWGWPVKHCQKLLKPNHNRRQSASPCSHLDKYTPKEELSPNTDSQLSTCQLHCVCLGSVSGRGLILLILFTAITVRNHLPCSASVLSFADWRALAYSSMYNPSTTDFAAFLQSASSSALLCPVEMQGHHCNQ